VLAFLHVPLVALAVVSFRGGQGTFEWYGRAFSDPQLLGALRNSLWVGLGTTVLSLALGTGCAIGLRRRRFPGRAWVEAALNLPLVLPEIVMGISLLVWFVFLNFSLGIVSIIIGHATFSISYVTLVVLARLATMDPLLEEASSDLGATPWRTFLSVTLPQLLPALASGALLAFTLSFDDFLITFFAAGVGSETLPVRIYSMLRFGITPEINAISTAILGVTLLAVFVIFRLTGSRKAAPASR